MKTRFTFKNGAVRVINEKAARMLQRAGKGVYQTRDIVAEERSAFEADAYIKAENARIAEEQAAGSDGLDDLGRDELFDLALQRGISVHHRSGADRIRALLRGESQGEAE